MCRANGVKELVGTTAIVADTPVGLMLSDKTLRLVPDSAQLHPKYLYYFLSSNQAEDQSARIASGSSGQNNISATVHQVSNDEPAVPHRAAADRRNPRLR